MKKLIVVTAAFLITLGAFAQETTDKKTDKMHKDKMGTKKMDKMDHGMKDCVMMKDGKMMVMKGGETMAMDKDMTLENGTTVKTDGNVMTKDGKSKMLKNGQYLNMDGKMGSMGGKMKMHEGEHKKDATSGQ